MTDNCENLSDSKCILLMGLDVDYKIKRGVKDDSKDFGLSNWVDATSFTEKGNPTRGFCRGWEGCSKGGVSQSSF